VEGPSLVLELEVVEVGWFDVAREHVLRGQLLLRLEWVRRTHLLGDERNNTTVAWKLQMTLNRLNEMRARKVVPPAAHLRTVSAQVSVETPRGLYTVRSANHQHQ